MRYVLMEELRGLPAQYQATLVMRYLEGQSRRAIAEKTDSTVGQVQGRLGADGECCGRGWFGAAFRYRWLRGMFAAAIAQRFGGSHAVACYCDGGCLFITQNCWHGGGRFVGRGSTCSGRNENHVVRFDDKDDSRVYDGRGRIGGVNDYRRWRR